MNTSEAMVSFNRALYGTVRRRTVFFKALTGILAFQMLFFGMAPVAWALPQMSGELPAGVTVSGNTMTISSGTSFTWDNGFNIGGAETVDITSGSTVHRDTSGSGSSIAGTLNAHGGNFWILNPNGISFNGANLVDVGGLLAAAMGGFDWGRAYKSGDVGGSVDLAGNNGSSYTVAIGQTVSGFDGGATVVQTSGMDDNATFSIASGGGTITFVGDVGAGQLQAGTINFDDGSSVGSGANGNVTASSGINLGDVTFNDGTDDSGNFQTHVFVQNVDRSLNQNGGTIKTSKFDGAVTQDGGTLSGYAANGNVQITGVLDQNAGIIDLGTGKLTLGADSTAAAAITAGEIDAGTHTFTQDGAGTITISGANGITAATIAQTPAAGTINASKFDGAVTQGGGTISGYAANGNVQITGVLDQNAGTIDLGSGKLTLGADSTAAAAITAGEIDAGTHTFTQDGAGTITISGANGITAATIAQTSAAGTINASAINGTVSQDGGTIQNQSGNLSFNTAFGEDKQKGTISAFGTLTLAGGDTLSGTVSAGNIGYGTGVADASKTITQKAGTITVSGTTADSLSAKSFTQEDGTLNLSGAYSGMVSQNASANTAEINATTLSGSVTQESGNAGTINATTLSGAVTQKGGTIKARNTTDGLSFSTLSTQSGEIDASGATLTLASGTTVGGTVKAGNIALSGSGTKTLTQDGANSSITVSGGSFLATGDTFTQNSGTLTLSNADGNTVNANVTQEDGTIKSQNGALTFATTVSKNAGIIGVSGQNVTFSGDVTQSGSGRIVGSTVTANGNIGQTANSGVEATTLTLGKATQQYELNGANNNISTLSGNAQSIGIDNGGNNLTLSSLSANADIGVDGANNVTLDGVSAHGSVRVLSTTGEISDTANQGTVTLELGRRDAGSDFQTVGSVNLVNGAGAITLKGVNAERNVIIRNVSVTLAPSGGGGESKGNIYAGGNVGIQTASLTQNGKAISGANVTLDQTDASGTLAVGGNITATGDILVRSANAVEVGAATLSAGNNIVVKGKSATVAGTDASNTANLTAKAVGVEATAGNVDVRNANFVAADGVALKASGSGATGNLTIGDNVSMKKTAAVATKDGSLVVYADESIDTGKLLGADRPADNLTIAKGSLGFSNDSTSPTEIDLNRFVYKTAQTDDAYINFSGAEIGIESAGNVSVAATRAEGVTIVSGSSGLGGNGAQVEATDAFSSTKANVNIGNSSGDDNLADGLVASGDGKTVTLTPAGSVTVASGAKISSNADLTLATADGKDFTVAQGGTVESTAGTVSITSKGALNVAGTVQTTADGKSITLTTNGTGDNAKDITISGTVTAGSEASRGALSLNAATDKKIDQTAGTITAGAVSLSSNTELAGNVTATSIDATGKTITQDGAGTITADSITASTVEQTYAGTATAYATINADTITATTFTQSGAYASASAKTAANGFTVTGAATQDAANGVIGSDSETVTLGSLDQDSGTVNATTLTLRDDSESKGTITAGGIVVESTADAKDKKLTQDGAGTITVTGTDGIKASEVVQSSTGTIKADKIDAALTQSGAAKAEAYTGNGTITITGAATQNGANATIGKAGQNVTLEGGATQNGHGKVLANTLAVTGADKTYTLSSTEGNNVATLTSKDPTAQTDIPTAIASVTINNGANALTVKEISTTGNLTVDKSGDLTLGSTANNAATADIGGTVTVTDAGAVSIAGLKADTVVVAKSGAVTDTGAALSAHTANGTPTVTLGQDATHKVASVLIDDSAKLGIAGIVASGDVGVKAEVIGQSGAIEGNNVTLDQTDTAGTLTVGKNITATGATGETGDILIRSANAVLVGDTGTAPTLEAANGSIVVKGVNEVTIDNANLTAKEIGVEATTEATATKLNLKNTTFVATGTGDGMDGVVLKSGGDLTIDTGVAAKTSATATDNKAQVTIYAGEKLNMAAGNAPAEGEKMTVTAKKLEGITLTGGNGAGYDADHTVTFDKFVYTEHADANTDLDFKFTGSTLSIKNDKGGVTVLTAGQDISIINTEVTGDADVLVEALDTTAATAGTKESLEIEAVETGSDGLVAKGNIEVDGTAGAGTIGVNGKVSSTDGTVKIESGGAIEVASGATVETKTADKGITLTTTGANATDITVKGETLDGNGNVTALAGKVDSKGDLTMTSAKDIALAGTVKTDGNLVMTAAKDINQTSGSVTANGEGKTTELTATAGSISLAATTGTGNNVAPANDFTEITTAIAKNAIKISDKNALAIAGATTGGSTTGASDPANSGDIDLKAVGKLTVTDAVGADGNVKLTAGSIDASATAATITAANGKTVTATAATTAKFGAKVEGDSVSLEAKDGTGSTDPTLQTAEIESRAGDVTLTAGTAATDTSAAKAGTIQANNTITATGGDVIATAQGNVTLTKAVDASNAGAVTITAANGGMIDASAAAATITAADGKAVTATADNGATFGATVQGKSVALTAKGGALTTDAIVTKAGAATLTAGTAATDTSAAKAGTIQANNTITATGGDVEATAQGKVTLTKAVQSTDNAVTITAENGGAIDASAAAATITAANGKAVTATAAGVATFGAAVQGGSVALTANGGALATKAVTATTGDATLTGVSVDAQDAVTANSGLVAMTATAGTVQTKAVDGQNVSIEATAGVTEGGAVNAAADKFVHTTGGDIEIGADFNAQRAVYKADNGGIGIAGTISGVTEGLGLEGQNLAVDGAKISGVNTLVVKSATGDIILSGKPANVQNLAVSAGGNLTIANGDNPVDGDFTFVDGAVSVAIPAAKPTADRTVAVNGLEAGGNLTANVAGTFATPGATAGGNVAIEAANVNIGDVAAGGNATITANGGNVQAGNVTAGGNATVEAATDVNAGAIAANGGNATVTAQNGAVNVASVAATGAAAVTAPGAIAATAGGIGGAGGTTVTKTGAGGAIAATGNIGQGGDTTIDANGAAINAAALASGGALTVNNAGDIEADIAAGGDATIQAGALVAGNTETGGDLTLEIGGDADVGTLAVGGDVNGAVDGVFTTVGGQVGSIGQNGGFQAGGGVMQNGALGSGPVTVVAGNYQLNGALNAGGSAVNIQAGGGIQGGGVLNAGPLTLNGGGIGTAANPLQINSANLQQLAGNGIYIVDTAAGPIAINVINSTGDIDLTIQNAQVAGGGTITAGGDFTLTTSQQFGSLQNPVNVAFGGTMTVNGINAPLLHIVIDGNENPGDLNIVYTGDGFAIWGNPQKGYQIVGLGATKQRLLDRALAFTVNTPELKSAQGIFGSPSFIHTRMNVSEARSMGNMDMLAINNTDFRGTWRTIRENAEILKFDWNPPVAATGDGPLANKIQSVKSEAEQQPELLPFARAVAQ